MAKGVKAEYNFMRIEKKYLMNTCKYRLLLSALGKKLVPDKYPEYTLRNIYYDTPDDYLIRTSIEKPAFKQKLRLRSYGQADDDDTVFLEIKKKVGKTVGKRRVAITYSEAVQYLENGVVPACDNPNLHEIDYFLKMYHPVAKQYVSYHRVAFIYLDDPRVRITFDDEITGRRDNLTLGGENCGQSLMDKDMVLMEIKVPGAIPREISQLLSHLGIFPVSFSKYGGFYKKYLLENADSGIVSAHSGIAVALPPSVNTQSKCVFYADITAEKEFVYV